MARDPLGYFELTAVLKECGDSSRSEGVVGKERRQTRSSQSPLHHLKGLVAADRLFAERSMRWPGEGGEERHGAGDSACKDPRIEILRKGRVAWDFPLYATLLFHPEVRLPP